MYHLLKKNSLCADEGADWASDDSEAYLSMVREATRSTGASSAVAAAADAKLISSEEPGTDVEQ